MKNCKHSFRYIKTIIDGYSFNCYFCKKCLEQIKIAESYEYATSIKENDSSKDKTDT